MNRTPKFTPAGWIALVASVLYLAIYTVYNLVSEEDGQGIPEGLEDMRPSEPEKGAGEFEHLSMLRPRI